MKVLIIQQKMIGDVLTSSILCEAIKNKYPDSELHYLINTHTYPVVEHNPYVDAFIFFSPEIENSKLKFYAFLKEIRHFKYDVVVDAYSKLSSNLITLFSRAKVKISKYKSYTAFLYDHPVIYKDTPQTKAGLAIENRLQLLEPLGITLEKPLKPKIYLTTEEKEKAKNYLMSSGIDIAAPLYMISVLGSGILKTYPFDYMARLLDYIVEFNPKTQILFNYIPKQKDDANTIYDLCGPKTQSQIFLDVFGNSLRDFMALTTYCDALIGNEGGAVNMAKALNVPTFTIFSPWIDKNTWNIFDDAKTNVSVHLKDYKPGIYKKPEKAYKKQALSLYEEFNPELFKEALLTFIEGLNEK
jgi:heptosyltransferase-2